MAERLQGYFYSETGTAWLVKVFDSNHVGATTDFQCQGIKITWTPTDEDERFSPILSSECRIQLLINNATLQTFVDDLVGADEGRFVLALSNIVGLGNTIAWNGYIIPDLVTIEDTQLGIGYILEIRAKDGLNWLKNVDYNDSENALFGQYVLFQVECLPVGPGDSTFYTYVLVRITDPDPDIDGYYLTAELEADYTGNSLPTSITLSASDWLIASDALDDNIAGAISDALTLCPGGYNGLTQDDAYTPEVEILSLGPATPIDAATFMVHTLKCLNRLPALTSLYTNSQTFLNVICNWYEDSRTYSASENPLTFTRIPRRLFYYRDVKGNLNYKTCYEVLEEICRAWGMRILFSGSAYWMVQVNEYRSPTSKTVFRYTKTGTETVATAQDLTIFHNPASGSNEVERFSGGNFKFYAAYKSVTVDYKHISNRNLIPGVVFETVTAAQTVEDIDDNGNTAALSFSGLLKYSGAGLLNPFSPFYIRLKMTLTVGTYYLTNSSGPEQWVAFADYYYISVFVSAEGTQYIVPVAFLTPPIEESGDLTIDVELDDIEYPDGTSASGEQISDWSLVNNYLEYLKDGTYDGQAFVTRYSTANNGTASEKLKVTPIIGDGPTLTAPGHIEVYTDASQWLSSDAWRVGNSGTYKAFSQLLCNEIQSGQVSPVKRFGQASMRSLDPDNNPLCPHIVLDYDSAYWVFQQGAYDIGSEIMAGTWWKQQTSAAYTENASEFLPEGSADGPATSSGPSGTGGGSGGGGGSGSGGSSPSFAYHQRFASHSSATLTITMNSGLIPVNKFQYIITQNGQFISPDFFSISGSVITLTFTPVSKNIDVIFWYP